MAPTGPLPKDLTLDAKYRFAMDVTDPAEAADYLELCIQHTVTYAGLTRAEATSMELQNIGYTSGYCDVETMRRVERLFGAVHPVLGSTEPGSVSVVPNIFAGQR